MTGSERKMLPCGSRTGTIHSYGRCSEVNKSTIWSPRPGKHKRQNGGNARKTMIMKGKELGGGSNPCPLLYPVKIYFGKQLIFHDFVI